MMHQINKWRQAPEVSRRGLMLGAGAAAAFIGAKPARAAGVSQFVLLNIMGGLDGLATVIPYGDPNLAGLRARLVPTTMLKLDSFFALHPAMPNLAAMFAAGEAMMVHAVGPCADVRSHFEGQDYLQSGTPQLLTTGWLARAMTLVPGGGATACLTLQAAAPLVASGISPGIGWAPAPFGTPTAAQIDAIVAAEASDPALQSALQLGSGTYYLFSNDLNGMQLSTSSQILYDAQVAARELSLHPTILATSLVLASVDTHADQNDRLPPLLDELDKALAALKLGLGSQWTNTVVMSMTEFGRTAYENGTGGSDHGTGFAVLLAGGAVAGGRVLANWPGLAQSQLFQGRDLYPTVDFRALALGVLMDHMGLPVGAQQSVFPGSSGIIPVSGLVR